MEAGPPGSNLSSIKPLVGDEPSRTEDAAHASESGKAADTHGYHSHFSPERTLNRHSPTSLDSVQGVIVDIDALRSVEFNNNNHCIESIKNDMRTMNTLIKDKGKSHIPVATFLSAFSHHGAIVTPCRQHLLDNAELNTTSTIKEDHHCTVTELHNNTLSASPSHGGVIVKL